MVPGPSGSSPSRLLALTSGADPPVQSLRNVSSSSSGAASLRCDFGRQGTQMVAG
jgi:hypothetical protein